MEEGIIAGGGVALIRAQAALEGISVENADEKTGVAIIRNAIEAPLRTIVANAGGEGSVVVQAVKSGEGAYGYNAREDKYEDMIAAGIIDPTKVTRLALENAASIAGLLLTTEAVISDIPEEKPEAPHMHGGGMGGMM